MVVPEHYLHRKKKKRRHWK